MNITQTQECGLGFFFRLDYLIVIIGLARDSIRHKEHIKTINHEGMDPKHTPRSPKYKLHMYLHTHT